MTLIDQYLEYIHEQTLTMMWMGSRIFLAFGSANQKAGINGCRYLMRSRTRKY